MTPIRKDIFPSNIHISVTDNISTFNENCTSQPCFEAGLFVTAPLKSGGTSQYIITINNNLLINVEHLPIVDGVGEICLANY